MSSKGVEEVGEERGSPDRQSIRNAVLARRGGGCFYLR